MKIKPVTEESSEASLLSKPKSKRGGYIPLNIFIMFTMASLILTGCILVWLSAFLVTSTSIENLNTMFIEESAQKISRTLEGFVSPLVKVTKMMATEWNTGVATISNMRDYLYPKINEFGFTSAGYFFNDTYAYRYVYNTQGTVSTLYWVYARQDYGSPLSVRDKVNITTGEVLIPSFIKAVVPACNTFEFWKFMEKLTNSTGKLGGFGDPAFALGSGMALSYSYWVYDQAMYKNKTKRAIGMAKNNLSLDYIVQYLSNHIKLLGDGYVVVILNSGTVIGGSINTTVNDGVTSAHIFEIETRGAGKVIKKFYELNGNTFNTLPKIMEVTSEGIGYIISPFKFNFEDLEWNILFVLYESDVNRAMVLSSSISVGVTVAIVILGIISSLLTGYLVSRPMKFLERQFEFIRVMDLDNVNMKKTSVFKEVHSIYQNLNETVMWLNEIKSFIPDSVFDQIRQEEEIVVEKKEQRKQDNDKSAKDANASSSDMDRHSADQSHSSISNSSTRRSSSLTPSLLKTGLSKKACIVVHVKLEGLKKKGSDYVTNFYQDFVSALGPVVKVNQATFQLISCDEFQFSITSKYIELKLLEKAFDCAKKILKSVESPVIPRMGICCGMTYVGNIGNKSTRYYSVFGDVPEYARQYCELAEKYNVNIISDDSNIPLDSFITRPLDRVLVKENTIHTIFQIIDKKNNSNDEWLYELENSKNNDKFKDYLTIFNIFKEKYEENARLESDLSNAVKILNNYRQNGLSESDRSYLHLSQLLSELNKLSYNEAISMLKFYAKKLILDLK